MALAEAVSNLWLSVSTTVRHPASLNDEELIQAARESSREQARVMIEILFARYHAKVVLWCLRLTGSSDEAADLAQEVLLAAYKDLDAFRGQSRFSTWLYTVMRNRFLNSRRSRKVQPTHDANELPEDLADSTTAFVDQLADAQRRRRVNTILQQELTETERTVMVLHYSDELPLSAITRVLGLTNDSGAKAFIVSARRKIQRALGKTAETL